MVSEVVVSDLAKTHKYHMFEDFEKIGKNDVTLRRDNTIFKVIIASILNEFCFRVKAIYLQDTTKSPITENKFR